MKCSLGISDFLEEISILSHSIVFPYFFALITEEGFLISPCCSLELCIQMGVSFLFSFVFSVSSQLFVRHPQTNHFAFLPFFLGDGLDHASWQYHEPDIAQCHEPVLRALQTLQFTRYYIFARKRVRVIREIFPEFLWDVESFRNLRGWAGTLNAI